MTMIAADISPKADLLVLLNAAVAAHANLVQVRVDSCRAVVETLAGGQVVAEREWPMEYCSLALPSAFALCDGPDDYQYGSSRSGRMTGEKAPLPPGLVMVFFQFFPARDGQRHMVARLTYDTDTCCGSCGG